MNTIPPDHNEIYYHSDRGNQDIMEDVIDRESTKDRDEELVNKIRSRMNEVEELIEAMKSKLPQNS